MIKSKGKKCKNCRELFAPYNSLQKYCFKPECVSVWTKLEREKKELNEWKKRKSKMKTDLMTLSDWLKIAQQHFNTFIRNRDKDQLCISCQKPPLKKNAGHFYNANNHYNVRFDERNVHLQCEHCNTFLSGSLINYRENLIKKIGIKEFEQLSLIANETRKFTIDEVKEIAEKYKILNKMIK
jgi:hypothetical protein